MSEDQETYSVDPAAETDTVRLSFAFSASGSLDEIVAAFEYFCRGLGLPCVVVAGNEADALKILSERIAPASTLLSLRVANIASVLIRFYR